MPLYDAYGRISSGSAKPVSGSAARRRFVPLPTQVPFQVDEVSELDGILTELEMGYFRRAAMLVDAMGRDDRIEGVISTRVGALKAAPLDIHAADESRKARKLAERFGGLDDEPGEWDQMFPPSTIGELLRSGVMNGLTLAEIVWDTTKGLYRPRLKCWHTQWIRWDWSRYCYVLLTAEGEIDLPRIDENPHSDGKWLLWCPYGYQYAWLRGAVRALGRKYVARQWNEADWSGYNEAHGHPTKLAIHPIEGDAQEHAEYVNAIANAKSQTTIGVPQGTGTDAPKYDMKLVEATARTWETFKARIESLDVDIAVLLLGQNLTTEVQGGSLAASATHNLVRMDKANEDAGIGACLRDQVLWHEARLNLGDGELAPRPVYQIRPPEDRTARATAQATTATAVATFKAAGSPINERKLLEEAAIPLLTEEEEAAQKAVRDEEAAAAMEAQQQEVDDVAPGEGEDEADDPAAAALSMMVVKRYVFAGLPIAVENPAGSIRLWRDDTNGLQIGSTKMLHDYGFIEGHLGSDDEELDVYVGPDEQATSVHVVHQLRRPDYRAHDEDKVMLGFASADAARDAYVAHRNDGDRAIGSMSSIPLDRFKAKLKRRTGSGKIRARAPNHDATISAILKLAARERGGDAPMAPSKRKTRYADRLNTSAVRLAARTLAVDLSAVRDVVDRAQSFDEMRKLLAERLKGMDPQRLARVFEKTRLMAKLAGLATADEEVRG